MSTQSPHPPTPKGSRNNRRAPKKNNTTPSTQKTTMLSTPPSSPPRNMSPGGITTDSSNNVHSKKKPPRSGKKANHVNYASPAPNGHRHTSSQPSNTTPQVNGSAAYAGPTFHASPAPSALPIPSFFSKSFPESDLAPTLETDSDNAELEAELETTPSKPRSHPQSINGEPEATPLDFLFKAAVQAQARSTDSLGSPEATTRVRSPHTDSRVLPPNPNSAPGGVFPFEMETPNHARSSQIGPSFAPSYQDRMNALRSSRSPSRSPDMTEEQRRIKTQELKHLLLNPRPQKPPSSVSPPHGEPVNYALRPNINGSVPHYATPMRTTSGPPVTLSSHGYAGQHQPMPGSAGRPPVSYPYSNGPQQYRSTNTNSPLRREVPASNPHPSAGSSPSPYRNHYVANMPVQQPDFVSPQPQYTSAAFSMPPNSPSPSRSMETKKMEDDLRRILKLDAGQSPGIPSSGMQSPFAT